MPQQLQNVPELPPPAAHLWAWFISISNERGNNGMSALKITADNVKSWMWFNGVNEIEPWERRAISALDNVWMVQYAEENKA